MTTLNKLILSLATQLGAFKLFMVLMILVQTLLTPVLPWIGKVGNIVIALWAAFILAYDFFHGRRLIRKGLNLWLMLFLAATAVSIAVNFRTQLMDNLEGYVMLVIQLMVLLPAYREDPASLKGDLRLFVNGLAAVMFLCSAAGFVLYTLDKPIYLYTYRFSGVFSNPNFASVMGLFGTLASLISLTCLPERHKKAYKVFHIVNALLCFVLFTVANSNTGRVMLCVALAALLFFLPFSLAGLKKIYARVTAGLLAAVVGAGVGYALYSGTQTAAAYVPGTVRYARAMLAERPERPEQPEGEQPMDKPTIEKENFNRSEEDVQLDNNRFTIWRQGFEVFKRHPVFGCGPRNIYEGVQRYVAEPRSEIEAGGLHNMYLELLATGGLAAFLPFMIWFALAAVRVIRGLAQPRSLKDPASWRLWLMGAGAAAFAVMNLTESAMLFSTAAYSMCFFVLLGFLLNLLQLEKAEGKAVQS